MRLRSMAPMNKVMLSSCFRIAVVAPTALCILSSGCEHKSSGDGGRLVDHGYWSYPRYEVTFPAFSPLEQSRVTVRCGHIPTARMTFGLRIVNRAGRSDEALVSDAKWANVTVNVTLDQMDRVGTKTIAEAHAPIREWYKSRSVSETMLWHENLRDIRCDRTRSYAFSIAFSGVQSNAAPISIIPVLEGGGNETP
jgi:hypothetical protein